MKSIYPKEDLQEELKTSMEGISAAVAKYDPGLHILMDQCEHVKQSKTDHEEDPLYRVMREWMAKIKPNFPDIDVRVKYGSYTVTNYVEDHSSSKAYNGMDGGESRPKRAKQKIRTVKSESPFYKLFKTLKILVTTGRCGGQGHLETKAVMEGVNLVLDPGKLYLILGAPGCGKSTLLKMIAGTLQEDKEHVVGGSVTINGIVRGAKNIVWSNLAGYIDQIDRLHARMTVAETLEFSWRCRSGGTHDKPFVGKDDEAKKAVVEADKELFFVNRIMEGLGLSRIKDTFVRDQQNVRGVSGGEKKRVTIAEVFVLQTPVACCDEISTGLDAATTYDIAKLVKFGGQITQTTKIISLLQPPPEVVALFDEVILLSEGRIIYFGPTTNIIAHFSSLGYSLPERMDVADWLQQLPIPDGSQFQTDKGDGAMKHMTTAEFKEKFDASELGKSIEAKQGAPDSKFGPETEAALSRRYKNSALTSLRLLVGRALLLWWRDKPALKAKIAQDIIMGCRRYPLLAIH